MSALDELKEIDLETITPLQAAVVYLSGKHEGDAALAAAELAAKDARIAELERLLNQAHTWVGYSNLWFEINAALAGEAQA